MLYEIRKILVAFGFFVAMCLVIIIFQDFKWLVLNPFYPPQARMPLYFCISIIITCAMTLICVLYKPQQYTKHIAWLMSIFSITAILWMICALTYAWIKHRYGISKRLRRQVFLFYFFQAAIYAIAMFTSALSLVYYNKVLTLDEEEPEAGSKDNFQSVRNNIEINA